MNQYIIIRDDIHIDPVTVVTEGSLIGRLPQCEVLLNHPSVSRVQAGIKQVENDYYPCTAAAKSSSKRQTG